MPFVVYHLPVLVGRCSSSHHPFGCKSLIGVFSVTIGLFWLGWTALQSIHCIVPMMSGLVFGAGYMLIFVALVNYLTDAYEEYSASAHSAASTMRSLMAAFLPVAASSMYRNLGIQWACSLLGFTALVLSIVPFVFMRFNGTIQKRSPFCQRLAAARSSMAQAGAV